MTFLVVQVVQEFSTSGGVETVAWELARAWDRAAVAQCVLACGIGEHPPASARIERIAPILSRISTRGILGRLGRLVAFPLFTLLATRAVTHHANDVVLSHGDCLAGDVLVVHAVDKASLIEKRRRGNWAWLLNPMHLWVGLRDRWMIGGLRYRRFVAVSPRVAVELQTLYRVPEDRISIIPNGVDLERFRPDCSARAAVRREFGIPAGSSLLLFAGHEFDRKGLRFAISALERLDPDTRLIVVGAGNPARYRRMPAALAGRVIFTGPRSDMPALYAAADAFVLPSAYETFSLVCMEAMACGVPVFATPVGGVEDYLQDGRNGYAIEQDAGSIASKLIPVLRDPARLAELGRGARATALRFGWDAVAERYTELLRDIWLQKQQRSGARVPA